MQIAISTLANKQNKNKNSLSLPHLFFNADVSNKRISTNHSEKKRLCVCFRSLHE